MPPNHRRCVLLAVADPHRSARLARKPGGRTVPPICADELDAMEKLPAHACGLVVAVDADSPNATRAARACWLAREQHVPVVLVRFGALPARSSWPAHPAEGVVDIAPERTAMFEELLRHCFVDFRTNMLPINAREYVDVVLVTGDPRPAPFSRAMEHFGLYDDAIQPFGGRGGTRERRALWFRSRESAPDTTQMHPLKIRALSHDPRRYSEGIHPADDVTARAEAVATLHATHGDWTSTRRLIEACMPASPTASGQLLSTLSELLLEPRASTWSGLCELARGAANTNGEKNARPFPPWVVPHLQTGVDENGAPWEEERLTRHMARVDELRMHAEFAARYLSRAIHGRPLDDDSEDPPWELSRVGSEERARLFERLVNDLLDNRGSMLKGFMDPEEHDRLTRGGD